MVARHQQKQSKSVTPLERLYTAVQLAYAAPSWAVYQRARAAMGWTPAPTSRRGDAVLADWATAQTQVIDLLKRMAERKTWRLPTPTPLALTDIGTTWTQHGLTVERSGVGSLPDLFLHHVLQLFETVSVAPLHACPAKPCDRVFIKVRKKSYCSTRCHRRQYMRDTRDAEKKAVLAVTADLHSVAPRRRPQREKKRYGKTTRTR